MRSYSASELSTIRARPQGTKWFFVAHKPGNVAYFELTSTVSYPASKLTVTYLSGASQSIRENQTVFVGTASGLYDLGMARITHVPTSNSVLWIAESGSGLINWNKSASTYLTVVNEMRPWSRHPRYDTSASQWRMDGDIVFSTEKQFAPYPNIDMTTIGILNGASSFSASYIGSSSLFWDAASLACSWYFPDGTTSTGSLGTEANPITKTYTTACPGGSYVRLQLVDANGGSTWGHRLTFLFNDYSQIPRVGFAEISGGVEQGGYTTQLNVYNLNDTNIPPGTEIFIFEEPNYAGSQTALGTNSVLAKNIIFRGWTTREVSTINPLTSNAVIEATTIDGLMQLMSSYDIFLAKVASITGASHWIETANLSLDRVAHQGLRWRSNVAEICNFTPASGLGIQDNIQFQSLGKGNLYSQLRSNYYDRGYLGYFGSDQQSNLFGFEDAQITGNSATVPLVMHIQKSDRMNTKQIDRDYRDLNSQVQLYAVASVTPLGAESPGGVMGYFGTTQEISQGLLVDSQDTLITWSGNLRAKQNAEFKRVNIPLVGNYKLDAIPQIRLTTSLSSQDNARGYSWNDKQFWLDNVRTIFDSNAGYAHQEIEISEIVDGIGGSAITFPTVDDIVSAPIQIPPAQPTQPPITNPGFGTGFGTVYVMTTTTLGRTRDFSASDPVWVDITGTITGSLREFILDPWTPATTGFAVSSTGVWKSVDLDQSSPTWTQILDTATITSNTGGTTVRYTGHIEASINYDGYVALFVQVTDITSLYCIYTTDRGDTWNYSLVNNNINTNDGWTGAAGLVQHLVGGDLRLFCMVSLSTFPVQIARYRSDNKGATWTLVASDDPSALISINNSSLHIPYNDNDNGLVWYIGAPYVAKTTDGGATFTSVDKYASVGTPPHRWEIESYTVDRQKMYRVFPDNCQIYTSDDGFTTTSGSPAMTGATGIIYSTGGFPSNGDQFYLLTSSGIYVSTDRGETWSDKTGDWSYSFTVSNRRGVIVPLWTE